MYRTMAAIANYEGPVRDPDRAQGARRGRYDLRAHVASAFGNGCSDGRTETNLFGAPRKKTVRTPTEFIS
jgi:nitrate reductase beta subunit